MSTRFGVSHEPVPVRGPATVHNSSGDPLYLDSGEVEELLPAEWRGVKPDEVAFLSSAGETTVLIEDEYKERKGKK